MEADEHRIRLTLHYDGSGFAGWQVQPGLRTVQGELEAALLRLTNLPARVIGAGRTDSGVHATGQVAGTVVARTWRADELRRALNGVLPPDIWVESAQTAQAAFHARYDAVARGYVYRVGTADIARSPFFRRWCWPLVRPLSLELLNDAAARFTGAQSFRAFAKTGQPARGERCRVYRAHWRSWEPAGFSFHVVANRFLHHMVRYMVGTMVAVARGRRPAADIDALLGSAALLVTSPPAPPEGLCLTRIYYEGDDWAAEDEP
ncbi:MAG TPA: tRNA pseudouridine(38-40) synthase TruA [Longimicrobiales bacterium]|nr:tRNA pseudouridine(38-40) synthase TruA [Longimicrobiales bacterium]